LQRHALHGLASPAGHGDEVADSITWDRPTALAVIAGVSALAACRQAFVAEAPERPDEQGHQQRDAASSDE
jgi:hypothetical protein